MKKINRTVNKMPLAASFVLLLLITFGFTSCLKNGKYNVDFTTVAPSVDLPLAATNNNNVVVFTFDATVTSTKIPFYINLASPSTLNTPVTATFALDSAYVTTYNTANGTNYQVMPANYYSVVNGWTRTIPAGKRLDSMYVTFNFSQFDLSQSWVLPVTIQSASVPIEQWNHLMISPSVKNFFDGHYTVTGTLTDAANGTLSGAYPMDVDLITAGPNTDYFNDNLWGGPVHGILSGVNNSYYGSWDPVFTFDPATGNVTSVVNYYGQPAGNGRSAAIDPTGINNFSLSTRNGDVKYFMDQPSVISPHRVYLTEHYQYLGPR